MHLRRIISIGLLFASLVGGGVAWAEDQFRIASDGRVQMAGETFVDMKAYVSSQTFRDVGGRCGFDAAQGRLAARPGFKAQAKSSSDCTLAMTQIQNEYWPSGVTYTIPVWFHVISKTNGTGNISDQRIYDQMTVLNEDFGAIANTLGANGFNVHIQFELAGIDRTVNDAWYIDNAESEYAYKTALAKDPTNYLNVYTNDAGGNLGYAYLPQGSAGLWNDGVVMLSDSIGGRNNGFSSYDEGRTLVHEVGHYLGLNHPWKNSGSCPTNSYTTGDLIFDTNTQQAIVDGCPSSSFSCGSSDPIDNYMGYADDACMVRFTAEQANRAVCSLVNYRAQLFELSPTDPTDPTDDTVVVNLASGLAGAEDSFFDFSLPIPEGATDLNFAMSGGTGDADLYVKFGALPLLLSGTDYDCYSGNLDNNENCYFSSEIEAGTWHATIFGYSAFSGVDLTASYQITAASAPSTPQIVSTDYGDEEIYLSVSVANNGGSAITSYAATCTDGTADYTGTSTTSRITVSGLTNGVSYSCSVTATNAAGMSTSSASSPSIAPEYIPVGLPIWLLHEATK